MTTPIKKSTLCHCGKKGLYRVNEYYYCSDHRQDGVERIKKFGNRRSTKPKPVSSTRLIPSSTIAFSKTQARSGKEQFRDNLRKNPTAAETILRSMLSCHPETIGRWVFQPIIHGYIPDFCNVDAMLIVEVDGGIHSVEGVRKYDARRTRHLKSKGYSVIRFKNESLSKNPTRVMNMILAKQKAFAIARGFKR